MNPPTSCETVLAEATRLEDKNRDFLNAIALLRAHLDSHPTCVEACVHLAADSGILRKFDDAEQYARTGVALEPDSGRAHYYLGCALRAQGRPEDALAEMERALVLIKRQAMRGTLAERSGLELPLVGWNRHVEEDVLALRMHLALRPPKPWDGVTQHTTDDGRQTYEHQRLGFALDLPDDWTLVSHAPPWRARLLARLCGVSLPDSSLVEFTCGLDESLNVSVMPLGADLPLDVTELHMKLEAQDFEFTDLTFGRIKVGEREHTTARYVAWSRVHSKKYLLVFGDRGYALTMASPDATRIQEREGLWDAIAGSFRLLPWAAADAAKYNASGKGDAIVNGVRDQLELRLERRALAGTLYGRAYDAAEAGDNSMARRLLERCLAEQPDHVLAHKELAVIYEKQGYLRRAVEHRRTIQSLDPSDRVNRRKLIALLENMGRQEEADQLRAGATEDVPFGDSAGSPGSRPRAHPWYDFLAALAYFALLNGLLWLITPWPNVILALVVVGLALVLTANVAKHGPRVGLSPWAARLLGVALLIVTLTALVVRGWWK
jgi:Tfp pilus assembly protein PilF